MDYIQQMNAFELWCETNYLPGASQLIWYKLFTLFNRCGWAEWVTVDNFRLMALTDMKSETTFTRARDKLIETGLAEYQKGKKGSPNRYRMVQLYTPNNEVNTVLIRSESDGQNGANPTVINKPNQTKPNQILDTPNVVSLDCWRSRYTPEDQTVIDTFFSILKHTRQSAKLSDSVIQKIYASWEPHPTEKVIYGLQKYIDNPSLHDKKENYVLGIIRNARANELQGGQGIYTPYQAENGKTISFAEIARRMEEA